MQNLKYNLPVIPIGTLRAWKTNTEGLVDLPFSLFGRYSGEEQLRGRFPSYRTIRLRNGSKTQFSFPNLTTTHPTLKERKKLRKKNKRWFFFYLEVSYPSPLPAASASRNPDPSSRSPSPSLCILSLFRRLKQNG